MAFGAQQIFPIDLNKSAAVGINIPFTGPTGLSNSGISGSSILFNPSNKVDTPFVSNFTTAAATKNNLVNYFLTNPGERPLNPTFGGGLRSFIFEQITTNNLDFLEERIEEDLEEFFPNVSVGDLQILREDNSNSITVSLTYSVINTSISDTLAIDFT